MGQNSATSKRYTTPNLANADAALKRGKRTRGRGALSNAQGRFERFQHVDFDDGWGSLDQAQESQRTKVTIDTTRSIISYNTSPDIPFDRSINAYRGCEHGCIYCFARPTHSFLGLSPGLDFEEQLFAKPNAAGLLRREIAAPNYEVRPIALGTNTDPYQPIERTYQITREILEVLLEAKHPVTIVTKSHSISRDLDILKALAEQDLVKVAISITTLDHRLARAMEPRASTPAKRLDTIAELSGAGIPTAIMFAPVIPGLNDQELEWILAAAADAGAIEANYILLRLPHEVKDLFLQWLRQHYPNRVSKVMETLRDMRGGKNNESRFARRMKGEGVFSQLLSKRFLLATRKNNLKARNGPVNTDSFNPPRTEPVQLNLL